MSRPTIITCAVTGGADTASKSPAVPVTPEEIANSSIAAGDAGAAIVHIHVRDPQTKRGSMALPLYVEVVERIRSARPNLIINLTTGAGGLMTAEQIRDNAAPLATPEARVKHVQHLRPEICTLDIATMNFGERVFVNSISDLTVMAELIAQAGVKPELEAFDVGQMRLIDHFIATGVLARPAMIQICLGVLGGAPADSKTMVHMASLLPSDSVWAGFGIGSQQFPMIAQALVLGGHVRVGLEDSLHIERGVLAPSNAALVSKAVDLMKLLGSRPATTDEARDILGLRPARS